MTKHNLSSEELRYLKLLIQSELDKYKTVSKKTKDPNIKEEYRLLNNLHQQFT